MNYLWDTLSAYGDVIQESDGSNNILASYTLGDGELLTEQRATVTSYALHDGQNSIRTLTNPGGGVTDSYLYDGYGNTRNHTGATVNPYQYGGQQTSDSTSGLYDLRARYYDPSVGRFLSMDAYSGNLTDPAQIDRYGYADGDPVGLEDPSGNGFIDFVLNFANSINNSESALVRFTAGGVAGAAASFAGYLVGFAVGEYALDSILTADCGRIDSYYSQQIAQCYARQEKVIEHTNATIHQKFDAGLILTVLTGFILGGAYAAIPFTSLIKPGLNFGWQKFIQSAFVNSAWGWFNGGPDIIAGAARTYAGLFSVPVAVAAQFAYNRMTQSSPPLLGEAIYTASFAFAGAYTSVLAPLSIANVFATGLITGISTSLGVIYDTTIG